MSAAAGKTYNFAFSENDMVGYYDYNDAMVRDDVDRSIFRIAGFENVSWPEAFLRRCLHRLLHRRRRQEF